ncbi:run domain Beclin-1-interacting and cysteine-rich domain-containing protein isoform X1 [Parasteatoda tepidariorum]|uniref:run domain Beclin-1-interacting and cysteine-rich domain-containing protein isoform X2 n=1 Tax=Parasteatoda tepidariorum TaxID=114398 RepID=UPI001C718BDD|nr:run domain Beclin-1-interacting and cysteine-rich domain-containing protein isoform X1 [Parasteatoda tepidariorum]XP_042903816.1 run domain Beclin-1-interacting and cysteine-rich domain-containing protein isoform X2 [Parasteatoda tepidariorum]XP_042903817.1 run domain Beclin-1-interacting and cysteine-rich domain-containing protein isoform X1 [Parasteatoda tepidariorum]
MTSSAQIVPCEENIAKQTISYYRSQRYLRKKRSSISQLKRFYSLQDKELNEHKKFINKTEASYHTKNPNDVFSHTVELSKRLCMNSGKNECILKKCSSCPDLLQISQPLLSFTSVSLPDIFTIDTRHVDLSTISSKKFLPSNSVSVVPVFENLYKNIVSVENLAEDDSSITSKRDNHSRFSSVDSSYSLISTTDIQEIDGVFKNDRSWRPQHSRSKSDYQPTDTHEYIQEAQVFSLPSSFSENKAPPRKSIFEGKQMVVPTECFFPRPQQGQTLTSFLSSKQFNISAELDRENAHFCISEALIAAIEHMKCSITQKTVTPEDESDEEIQELTQRIRIRKRERQQERTIKNLVLLSDGKTDTTSQSASPPLSSHSSDFEADSIRSEDEVEDLEYSAHTESNLSLIKESGLSLSMASLYSDADLHKARSLQKDSEKKLHESDSFNMSAESVALSLLKRFSEKHLPKASELQWLVSEQEAPQRLLPLPDSWPVSPDFVEEECYLTNIRLRGNTEWAPPRAQIISIIHPHLKRKDIIEKQKYRCAGCGMKIEKSYIKKFRYCNYFGKYFCQCCHSNGSAYIPGYILWKWDFTKYYVSKFAWDLLDNMFNDPLFNIEATNPKLYKKVRALDLCLNYRMQLFYLKDFMKTCRKAELVQVTLEAQNQHILYDPNIYSLSDLIQVKNGEMLKHVKMLTNYCIEHVNKCILCQAKGFVCEICENEKDIIFSFQLNRVVLCQVCGSCFHKSCFKNVKCPRCIRIAERKKRFSQERSNELFV